MPRFRPLAFVAFSFVALAASIALSSDAARAASPTPASEAAAKSATYAKQSSLGSRVLEVENEYVTLGEIWPDAPENIAMVRAFHAPAVGAVGRVSSESLYALALGNGIELPAQEGLPGLIIRRKQQPIDESEVRGAIVKAAQEGYGSLPAGARVQVNISDEPSIMRRASFGGDYSARLTRLNRKRGTFAVELTADNCTRSCTPVQVVGTSKVLIPIPVLSDSINRDQLIKASDITQIHIPERRNTSNTIRSAQDLIGKVAKRPLAANQPIAQSDVKALPLVGSNDRVTVQYTNGPLQISLHGVALEEGAAGELVRVRNVTSLRVLYAKVIAPGLLSVGE